MMEMFRRMVNDCIRIGLQHDASTMKRLCNLSYAQLEKYDIISYYKLCAISRAAGILANRKKSIKRGHKTKDPHMKQPLLISCYGFKVKNSILRVPLGNRRYCDVPLNNHTKAVLTSDPTIRIRSFLITPTRVSICFAKEIEQYEPRIAIGIDRNLANLTVGNNQDVTQYNVEKLVQIAENSRSVTRALRRNDVRIRKQLSLKHDQRRKNRVHQLLHKLSKAIVKHAKEQKATIVFEDIRHIRGLYLRGNYQSRNYRAKMNSWPYYELERQVKYKAVWEGIPVLQLSKTETRGTSKLCPRCGKRTQEAARDDVQHKRQLWCEPCRRWLDRDVVAAMNIAYKGLLRFSSPQGAAGEAMVQESGSKEPVILKVDAAKLNLGHEPMILQN
jgi:putative transposase